jgi:hypothetical protein
MEAPMATSLDLTIEQGATFKRVIKLYDSAGTAIDLTGKTFAGQLRKTYSELPSTAFTFTLANQTTNPGEVEISLTAAQTRALKVNPATNHYKCTTPYAYDIEMTVGSDVSRILEGTAHISPEVTRNE